MGPRSNIQIRRQQVSVLLMTCSFLAAFGVTYPAAEITTRAGNLLIPGCRHVFAQDPAALREKPLRAAPAIATTMH